MTRITFVGHATTLIETKGTRIITDPVLRKWIKFLWRYGGSVNKKWYKNELEVAKKYGVKHINIRMNSRKLPSRENLLKLLDAYKTAIGDALDIAAPFQLEMNYRKWF